MVGGEVNVNVRYRYEYVDQDNDLETARASTIRTRLGYRTGRFQGFEAFVEVEDIREVGEDDFNSTTNGKTRLSVVADPETTEVNQAYLGYTGFGTIATIGRKRIILTIASSPLRRSRPMACV